MTLSERLRTGATMPREFGVDLRKYQNLCDEAADEIDSLTAKNARMMADSVDKAKAWDMIIARDEKLKAAESQVIALTARVKDLEQGLRPFAEATNRIPEYGSDDLAPQHCPVTYGDFRRARALIGDWI